MRSTSSGTAAPLSARKTLIYNPQKRMTVEQGLNHPYVKEFKSSEDEVVRGMTKVEVRQRDRNLYG